MGYYNGGWKTYMDNTGHFYLCGANGGLAWNGNTLIVCGTVCALSGTFNGTVCASAGAFSGTVCSCAGNIGGWTLANGCLSATNAALYSGAANTARIQLGAGACAGGINSANAGTDILFWGGKAHANRATAPFRVTAAGALIATNATICGMFAQQQATYRALHYRLAWQELFWRRKFAKIYIYCSSSMPRTACVTRAFSGF